MDRHNHVGRAYHGLAAVPKEERYRLYRDERVAFSTPRFAWIDTLFALPEAALFAQVIDLEETAGEEGRLRPALHRHPRVDGPDPRRRDPEDPREGRPGPLHRPRPGAGAGAPQAALLREEALPAHQLPPRLHRGGDAPRARRRAPRVPELAQLLRRGDHGLGEARLLLLELPLRRARRGGGADRPARSAPSSAATPTRAATGESWRSCSGPAGIASSTSATTSTATSCARRRARSGAPASSSRSWSGRSTGSTSTAPSWRRWPGWRSFDSGSTTSRPRTGRR